VTAASGGGSPRPRLAVATALALAAAALPAMSEPAGAASSGPRPDDRPNIIVVVTDDQAIGSFRPELMPRTFRRFVDSGTEFTESIVATPLCCPSRAVLATGQYGHNNGVLRNQYSLLADKRHVLPAWLRRAGYRTMHLGRFFNGYGFVGRNREVAPGWEVWRTMIEPYSYYDYRMRFNNRFRRFGDEDRDYLTTNLNRIAAKLVRRHSARSRPFYLQLDHFAPHVAPDSSRSASCTGMAAVPAPADEDAFADEPLPQGPSFNEADISDKPGFLQELPLLGDLTGLVRGWRCQLASLLEVDRGMGQLWGALRDRRVLRDTAVIFTSDNGYLFGEHRLSLDKHYPYQEALRVPLAIRLPRALREGRQPPVSRAPVANIDVAPTILELAGAEPCKLADCRTLDGRPLVGAAAGRDEIPPDRGIAVEYDAETPVKGLVCEYQGIRTTGALLVEHARARSRLADPCEAVTGAIEHYDLRRDPFELDNLYPAGSETPDAGVQAGLLARSRALAGCAGIAGRDPLPPSGHHCE
jgi:N-acetylglucosamine-6-sulfatase